MDKAIIPISRRYVYKYIVTEVMEWARIHGGILRPPNYKTNFPYFLSEYIKYLKFKANEK